MCKSDLFFGIDGISISNYGEVWNGSVGVSLNVLDVLSSVGWGSSCVLNVCRVGGSCVDVLFRYEELVGSAAGELRLLDSVLDVGKVNGEVLCFRGVVFKPLRLNDVVHYNLVNYMGDDSAHLFRMMVSNIESHCTAYHAKSIRPGDILHKVNGLTLSCSNFNEFAKMLNDHPEDEPLHLETESNKIIII